MLHSALTEYCATTNCFQIRFSLFITCVLWANNWLIGGKTSWEKPRHNLGIKEGRYFCKDETLHLSCCCGSGWGRGWGLGVRLWGNEQEDRKDPSVPIVANEERAGRSRMQSRRKVSVKSTFLIFNLLWFSFQTKFGVSVMNECVVVSGVRC